MAERFKLLEARRLQEIHKKRQAKVDEEIRQLTHSPATNPSGKMHKTFLQRQEDFQLQSAMKKSQMQSEKEAEHSLELTFTPEVHSGRKNPRTGDRIVQDLFHWGEQKEKRLKELQEAKLEEELSVCPFSLSKNSEKLAQVHKRRKGQEEQDRQSQRKVPYWPLVTK